MSVSPEAWAHLLSAGSLRIYEPAAVLLRQGEPATHVLALVAGRVNIARTSRDGDVLILAIRGPGEILGDISVFGGKDRSATVIAVDRCETRIIPSERFLDLVRSLGLEAQLLRHAMTRIRESEAWRAELAALPAGPRIVRALLHLTTASPADRLVGIGLDQTELGYAVGLARSTVAAELGQLRAQGIITTSRRRIVILDLRRLKAMAAAPHGSV